jgi:hypothetical protein
VTDPEARLARKGDRKPALVGRHSLQSCRLRPDTAAFHQAAAPLYDAANTAILRANTIDVASRQTYTLWSRNPVNGQTAANVTWILRP